MRILVALCLVLTSIPLYGQNGTQGAEALYSKGLARTIPPNVDFVEAANLFRQAAEKGSVRAQRSLGELLLNGQGVNKDEVEAAKWLRKAADKGDPRAQSDLGSMYVSGLGVKKDRKEALKWFKKAAEQGDVPGQVSLGVMYMTENVAESIKWLRKGADQGSPLAQVTLGRIYEGNLGVGRNRAEALSWYTKALQQGFEDARKPLEVLRNLRVISPEEAAANLLTKITRIDPPLARAARVNADVVLEIAVDDTGKIATYQIIQGHPLLNDAAINSIAPSRYRPYLVNGQPTSFITSVTVKYAF